jgi:hypothetical protein
VSHFGVIRWIIISWRYNARPQKAANVPPPAF